MVPTFYDRTVDLMFTMNWRPPQCVTILMVQPGGLGCSDIWTLHASHMEKLILLARYLSQDRLSNVLPSTPVLDTGQRR